MKFKQVRAVFTVTHMCSYTMPIDRIYAVYNYFNKWNTNEYILNYASSLPSTPLLNERATTDGRAAYYGLLGIKSWWRRYIPYPSRPATEPMRPLVK